MKTMEPVFADGKFCQAGVAFQLPTISTLMDRLNELNLVDLQKLLDENGLPHHDDMPLDRVVYVVGSVIQQKWFHQTKGAVPERIARTARRYTEQYHRDIEKLRKGETIMATKREKKQKKEKKPRVQTVTVFEIDPQKARAYRDGKYTERNGKNELSMTGIAVMIRCLIKKSMTHEDLIQTMKKEGHKFESKTPNVYGYLNELIKARVLKKVETPALAA